MTWVACALAAACVLVLTGPTPRQHLRTRLPRTAAAGVPSAAPSAAPSVAERPAGRPRKAPILVLAGLGGCVLVLFRPSGIVLAVTAALVAGGVGWLWSRGRRRRQVEHGRRRTLEICDALAAEMRAGQPSAHALARVAEQYPDAGDAARACLLGADVPAALRRAAAAPGAGGMTRVTAAWQVADASGCGLVATLDRVAEGLRADDATSAEVTAALSPARATARMLAVLPAFGLLLGAGMGGDPLALLVGTPVGNALLLAGVLLALAGTVWVERLTDVVES